MTRSSISRLHAITFCSWPITGQFIRFVDGSHDSNDSFLTAETEDEPLLMEFSGRLQVLQNAQPVLKKT
jgi:hypothetical protein